METIYDRQNLIFKQDEIPGTLFSVGCGGVGWWASYFSAMAGVPKIVLCDFDTVSTTNLGRLPVSKEDIGKPKTTVLAAKIKEIRPECQVVEINEMLDSKFLDTLIKMLSSGKIVILSAVD